MDKLNPILGILNSVTGRNTRHNKALRDVRDWTVTVQEIITTYDLYGSSTFDKLLKNIGDVKFDFTRIVHKARFLIKTSRDIKGESVSQPIEELIESIEDLRRVLSNASLHHTKLSPAIQSLCTSFEKLQDTLSDIEYK